MADQTNGPVETGAAMDYSEHDKTYAMFLAGTKYTTIVIVALMIAMAVYFFTGAGAILSFVLFLILSIGGSILAR
ncbi:MAG: aa3-type cytochrome c oxidase subunit IV [Hoeflea sp.]|uniref:aa3-type cytochrome c oxidase subunit IV n=1 Tax=Hoeflea sp. TaxID=1940281 RepID=UPI001DDBE21F|nr:aa3-type cytochrome c oxidase subunit IV [Hoeflea sp.]MBU4528197.1 aa3-type cytochrome c oxidase subunit IV [Alphaproteobacteria bacterium]MBU4543793.1 aa3-type cytochrome c oxidase subunit IV [Alphaproteobacteria bacterium]MBU4548660.1 aa3-type cytochrome c oxidase subunit IV [Alphaproteobacteria bacterium]MBV1725826.1 aa3-type cytochrome c oxidase subunit IV [Hoeflea sp.]MBV1762182.1 aa3-type cytochrome c oxidase subunit IV [Hoeflea sp.]